MRDGQTQKVVFTPYKINTTVTKEGAIRQCTYQYDPVDAAFRHILTQVIQTREDTVRAALIGLGWTPPPEK